METKFLFHAITLQQGISLREKLVSSNAIYRQSIETKSFKFVAWFVDDIFMEKIWKSAREVLRRYR